MSAVAASVTTQYDELCTKLKELSALQGIEGLLGWDEMVMMPEGSAASRAAQKSALAGVVHEKVTDPEIGSLLADLKDAPGLDEWQAAVVREAARGYKKATALSKELTQRKAALESEGYAAWVKARAAKDFSLFAPKLQEWVDLAHATTAAVDPSRPPYDVALDDFEKNMSAARLDEIFGELKAGLTPLIAEIKAGTPPDAAWTRGAWDTKAQAALCNTIVKEIGFDTTIGRLDVSVHPFTGGSGPTDVRMTTRFKEDDVTEGLTGAIHECGHALYEQGRNLDYEGLPVNSALSMGVHESQSLLWERMVALSPEFCEYLLPKLRETFPDFGPGKTAKDLYAAINTVRDPSFIRVESDEVTYPLHIIIRYEIERQLVEGSLRVEDVPGAWNAKMQEYLGCTPEDDAQGCLQDVHWGAGLFGYFPTYTLGAMYAAQIFFAANKELPNLKSDIAQGKFTELREWLREKVHKRGSLPASGDDLMIAVTGEPLNVQVFLDYLRTKYRALYQTSA